MDSELESRITVQHAQERTVATVMGILQHMGEISHRLVSVHSE
jgi:hypothetical protein